MPKVLVVDDDYSFASYTKLLLDTFGYESTLVFEGKKAVAAAKAEKPHVILCDASLPDLNGIEIIKALKADPETAKIPILMCSITRQKSELNEGFSAGALDFIPKPLDRLELKARIDEVLSLKK